MDSIEFKSIHRSARTPRPEMSMASFVVIYGPDVTPDKLRLFDSPGPNI